MGTKKVRRLMKEDNLLAVRRRKFVATTDSDHDFVVYPNLAEQLIVNDMNQLWVSRPHLCPSAGRVRVFGRGAGCIFTAGRGLGVGAEFAGVSAAGGFGKRDPQPATQDWVSTSFRPWVTVRQQRLCEAAGEHRGRAEYEPARAAVGKWQV